MSMGSLNAVPKKLTPSGAPNTIPAGTCTMGYPGGAAEPGCAENEVIAKDQIGRPCRVIGGANYCVEVKLSKRGVDAVDAGVLVDGQRLVVGHAAKGRLRIVGTGHQRIAEIPNVLIKEWHLGFRIVILLNAMASVKVLCAIGYSGASGEIGLQVILNETSAPGIAIG